MGRHFFTTPRGDAHICLRAPSGGYDQFVTTPLHPLEPDIAAKLGDDFERKVLSAALLSLEQGENPLSLNNFATAIRELSRNVLQRLAPDNEVPAP